MPAMMRRSVLFPLPFGATMPMRLRGPTVRLTRSSTTCGPNALATSRATTPPRELRADRSGFEVGGVEDTTAPARVERAERAQGRAGPGADPEARTVVRHRTAVGGPSPAEISEARMVAQHCTADRGPESRSRIGEVEATWRASLHQRRG